VYGVQPVFALQASTAVAGQDPAFILYNSATSAKGSLGYSISGDYTYYLSDTVNRQIIIYNTTSPNGTGIQMIGNVGIGAASPLTTLQIAANKSIGPTAYAGDNSNPGQLIISGSTNANLRLAFMYDTSNNFALIQSMEYLSGGKPLLLNAAGGNVGIGTTGTVSPLTVQAPNNQATFADLSQGNPSSKKFSILYQDPNGDSTFYYSTFLGKSLSTNGTTFTFHSDGTNRFMSAIEFGNAGLNFYCHLTQQQSTDLSGITMTQLQNSRMMRLSADFTTSTLPILTLSSGSRAFPVSLMLLESAHATSNRACIQLGESTSSWQLLQDTAGNGTRDFAIYGNGDNRLNITPTGNVGIGWNTAMYKMDIYSSTLIDTDVFSTLRIQGNGGGGKQAVIDMSSFSGRTGGPAVRIAAFDDSNYSSHLVFSTAAGGSPGTNTVTERMRITSSGLVGIGTIDPQATVDIRNKLIVGDYQATGFYNSNAALHIRRSGVNTHLIIEKIGAQTGSIVCVSGGMVYGTDALNVNFGYHSFRNGVDTTGDVPTTGTELLKINSTGVITSLQFLRTPGSQTAAFQAYGPGMSSTNYNYGFSISNDTGNTGVIFMNGSARTTDGGANTLTIRNDGGDIRLQSSGSNGILVKSGGYVAIGTTDRTLVSAPLTIYNASTGNDPSNSQLYVYNPTNGANQSSIISCRIAGSASGSAYYSLDVNGSYGFSMGMAGNSSRLQFRNAWNFTGSEVMSLYGSGYSIGLPKYTGSPTTVSGFGMYTSDGFDAAGTTHTLSITPGSISDNYSGLLFMVGKNTVTTTSSKVGFYAVIVHKRWGFNASLGTVLVNSTSNMSVWGVSTSASAFTANTDSDVRVAWQFFVGI
jgi:hypothetical protein